MPEHKKPLLSRIIIEMLGAPAEHIKTTMDKYLENLKKNHTVLNVSVAEPKQEKRLFSVFAELEMRFKNLAELFEFCFEAMPSSVEVVEPEELRISVDRLNGILNDLQAKLHDADMIVKTLRAKQEVLDTNATNVFRRFLMFLCEKGVSTPSEMSHYVGVGPKELTPFLEQLTKEGKLAKEDGKYVAKHE